MRLFVTQAQDAEMRAAISNEYFTHYAQVVIDREAQHAAELARLVDPSGPFVTHLKAEVAFWRLQFQHERQRAEMAIDQCRVTHQAIGPVTLPPREMQAMASEAVSDIFRDPELAAMGLTEGVG